MLDHWFWCGANESKNISYQSFLVYFPRKRAVLEHSIKTTPEKRPQIELFWSSISIVKFHFELSMSNVFAGGLWTWKTY